MNPPEKKPYQALLLDLDGTMIDLNLESFLPAYMEALATRLAHLLHTNTFEENLIGATKAMILNGDPATLNSDAFYQDFCRRTGLKRELLEPGIDQFYENEFPRLARFSRPLALAPQVLAAAEKGGLDLVLATNPIFPEAAILERMAWGKLDPHRFKLITTMDNMHFCKPNPDYYREIGERIGKDPALCLMAGNDTREDLVASAAGMDTFLVEDFIIDRLEDLTPTYRGSLADLHQYLLRLFPGREH